MGHRALTWSRKENKCLKVLLNLLDLKSLKKFLIPTHKFSKWDMGYGIWLPLIDFGHW
jgi:hypothetical protein